MQSFTWYDEICLNSYDSLEILGKMKIDSQLIALLRLSNIQVFYFLAISICM